MCEYSCGVRGGGAEPGRMSVGLEAAGSIRGVPGGNRTVRNDAAASMAVLAAASAPRRAPRRAKSETVPQIAK